MSDGSVNQNAKWTMHDAFIVSNHWQPTLAAADSFLVQIIEIKIKLIVSFVHRCLNDSAKLFLPTREHFFGTRYSYAERPKSKKNQWKHCIFNEIDQQIVNISIPQIHFDKCVKRVQKARERASRVRTRHTKWSVNIFRWNRTTEFNDAIRKNDLFEWINASWERKRDVYRTIGTKLSRISSSFSHSSSSLSYSSLFLSSSGKSASFIKFEGEKDSWWQRNIESLASDWHCCGNHWTNFRILSLGCATLIKISSKWVALSHCHWHHTYVLFRVNNSVFLVAFDMTSVNWKMLNLMVWQLN